MILGIDPGATGAVAFFNIAGFGPISGFDFHSVQDMPVVGKTVNPVIFAKLLTTITYHITHAYIEKVQSMPRQGVVSVCTFCRSAGIIEGVLGALNIPVTLVSPQKWKKAFGLIGKDKEASRALAIQWYPKIELNLKKHHGRAEALLIARWGMNHGTT